MLMTLLSTHFLISKYLTKTQNINTFSQHLSTSLLIQKSHKYIHQLYTIRSFQKTKQETKNKKLYTTCITRVFELLMTKCFSLTGSRTWCYRSTLSGSGLRSKILDLGDGTVMHYWAPKAHNNSKPNLLLIHGFGANAMWQWAETARHMAPSFNLYIPDLVFFGDSYTTRPERSEAFQARCVISVLEKEPVGRVSVVGMSYGGFVAYSLAAQWREGVERVVVCCAGVCLEERDLREGMFKVGDLDEASDILLPRTAEKMRELLGYTLVRPPKAVPSCLLQDFIDEMFSEHVEEKKELIRALAKGRKLSDLPKISQPTLIIWGDQDQVFPLELGYRLKRHLGDNAELAIIENAGHAFLIEKPKELYKLLKSFLSNSMPLSTMPGS